MKFATLGSEFARVQKLRGLVLGGNLNWSKKFAYNPKSRISSRIREVCKYL
jgi:hypothetical protein